MIAGILAGIFADLEMEKLRQSRAFQYLYYSRHLRSEITTEKEREKYDMFPARWTKRLLEIAAQGNQ